MIAATYARKSTSQAGRDDDDKSVARQIDNARAFATTKGWTVNDAHVYFDDAVSGAETNKLHAKQTLLDLIRSGNAPFQVLVIQSNDRLSRRDGDEAFAEMKMIARAGISIWFYDDGTRFEYGTLATNTLGFMRAEFAAEFRRAIAVKTAEAMRRKTERGHVCGGRTFGYDNVRVNSHTERRINDVEAAVIRHIYDAYAGGTGLSTIAHTLNAEGTPCPRAQQGRVPGWCPSSVREILKRPLYRGEVIYGKRRKRDLEGQVRPTRRPESEWLRVETAELRIVSPELGHAVTARLEGQRTRALRLHDGRLMGRPSW